MVSLACGLRVSSPSTSQATLPQPVSSCRGGPEQAKLGRRERGGVASDPRAEEMAPEGLRPGRGPHYNLNQALEGCTEK